MLGSLNSSRESTAAYAGLQSQDENTARAASDVGRRATGARHDGPHALFAPAARSAGPASLVDATPGGQRRAQATGLATAGPGAASCQGWEMIDGDTRSDSGCESSGADAQDDTLMQDCSLVPNYTLTSEAEFALVSSAEHPVVTMDDSLENMSEADGGSFAGGKSMFGPDDFHEGPIVNGASLWDYSLVTRTQAANVALADDGAVVHNAKQCLDAVYRICVDSRRQRLTGTNGAGNGKKLFKALAGALGMDATTPYMKTGEYLGNMRKVATTFWEGQGTDASAAAGLVGPNAGVFYTALQEVPDIQLIRLHREMTDRDVTRPGQEAIKRLFEILEVDRDERPALGAQLEGMQMAIKAMVRERFILHPMRELLNLFRIEGQAMNEGRRPLSQEEKKERIEALIETLMLGMYDGVSLPEGCNTVLSAWMYVDECFMEHFNKSMASGLANFRLTPEQEAVRKAELAAGLQAMRQGLSAYLEEQLQDQRQSGRFSQGLLGYTGSRAMSVHVERAVLVLQQVLSGNAGGVPASLLERIRTKSAAELNLAMPPTSDELETRMPHTRVFSAVKKWITYFFTSRAGRKAIRRAHLEQRLNGAMDTLVDTLLTERAGKPGRLKSDFKQVMRALYAMRAEHDRQHLEAGLFDESAILERAIGSRLKEVQAAGIRDAILRAGANDDAVSSLSTDAFHRPSGMLAKGWHDFRQKLRSAFTDASSIDRVARSTRLPPPDGWALLRMKLGRELAERAECSRADAFIGACLNDGDRSDQQIYQELAYEALIDWISWCGYAGGGQAVVPRDQIGLALSRRSPDDLKRLRQVLSTHLASEEGGAASMFRQLKMRQDDFWFLDCHLAHMLEAIGTALRRKEPSAMGVPAAPLDVAPVPALASVATAAVAPANAADPLALAQA
ncbi:hypothetical protein [Achromobacter aloeverae]|uniref:Uncharacterized protein n=1 Tax=Achromobacter aloeverae TaxID=1750518 RepID=A0A4Q1HI88_9BURK|nr:hypothetical protein [Achromobacter aloeverae]RXN85956.1 hypothetical protein C7R54_19530 [Achromobacter aloeverae]